MIKELKIEFQEFDSEVELTKEDRELLQRAKEATDGAYSPYSHFSVGAALRLKDGTIVTGANQENVAYPSGLCAERTAIFAASAQHPECREYDAIAIVGRNEAGEFCEASPCGACRQSLMEYETRQKSKIKIICSLPAGRVRILPSVGESLPFSFVF